MTPPHHLRRAPSQRRSPRRRGRTIPRAPHRPRRALSEQPRTLDRWGDPELAAVLAGAVEGLTPQAARRGMHGFHTYPARMHPDTAARLLARLGPGPGQMVLDPFCGSGTVLLEARQRGLPAWGIDLNPLAVRLSRLKTRTLTPVVRKALNHAAPLAAGRVMSRLRGTGRAQLGDPRPPRVRGPGWGNWTPLPFAPGVWAELQLLAAELQRGTDPLVRAALELVLSSIVVRASQRVADTSQHRTTRVRRPGWVCGLFIERARELVERWAESSRAIPANAPPARIDEADARQLAAVPPASIGLILTSPPYPNVYDYLEQHRERLDLLGLDAAALQAGEIGAPRTFSDVRSGIQRWDHDGRLWVGRCARVLRPGGRALVLIGDGVAAGRTMAAEEHLRAWAAAAHLEIHAGVSMDPLVTTGPRFRREHLILLGRPERQFSPVGTGD